ncbi:MAG TPA: sigma-54 dependent transcriptional regulator [Candidatus Deferrimicrobiaceae bacterium]|jgi:two-component system response regulator PilR (NtrC family)
MARVLVVDDEQSLRQLFKMLLEKEGYAVDVGGSLEDARQAIAHNLYDLVLTDLKMVADDDGLKVLRAAVQKDPSTQVVVLTAYGTIESAKEAMRLGAYDYIQKPFNNNDLRALVRRALESRGAAAERTRELRAQVRDTASFEGIVGRDESMLKVFALIDRVAPTGANIMILGESGTGKELVATALHMRSPRHDFPFVPINCAAIPESLMESELFGHVRGAFTGAIKTKKGLFEAAHKGTLFLDEVGELPPMMQGKLLRAIQERSVRRIGGNDDIPVDVRIVCASKRNLEDEMQAGRFRDDLFFRLNVIQIVVPPLRERREDIPFLARQFVEKYSARLDKPIRGIRNDAMAGLCAYDYPGNVRELENIIERATIIETSEIIVPDALPSAVARLCAGSAPFPSPDGGESTIFVTPREIDRPELTINVSTEVKQDPEVPQNVTPQAIRTVIPPDALAGGGVSLDAEMDRLERELLLKALSDAGGNKTEASKLLNISFRSLRYRLDKHGME